jgi:hypothetical protein
VVLDDLFMFTEENIDGLWQTVAACQHVENLDIYNMCLDYLGCRDNVELRKLSKGHWL